MKEQPIQLAPIGEQPPLLSTEALALKRFSESIHHFFKEESIFERIDTLNEVFSYALQATNGDVDDGNVPIYSMSHIAVIDLFDKQRAFVNFLVNLHLTGEYLQKAVVGA